MVGVLAPIELALEGIQRQCTTDEGGVIANHDCTESSSEVLSELVLSHWLQKTYTAAQA
jgi:hypothetical protein